MTPISCQSPMPMTFYKHTQLITEGYRYYEIFWPLTPGITEKRPFLFPFFVSLTHTLFGYRVENVFIMNFFVLWVSLFLLYLLVRAYLDEIWAYASIILVVAQPVICLSAASGSFEMFNLMFILISFLSLRHFLERSDSASFLVLALSLIMVMNSRYESILVLVTVMTLLFVFKYPKFQFLGESTVYALIPFFVLPWTWQRILMVNIHDDLPGGTWVKAFGLHNITTNLPPFLRYAFDWSGHKGFAGAIDSMGVLAACYFLTMFFISYRKRVLDKKHIVLFLSMIVSIFLLLGIVLLYSDGLVTKHPMNGRFFIPFLTALSVLSVCSLAYVVKDASKLAFPVLLGSIVLFIYYHPVAVEDALTNNLIIIREARFVEDFMRNTADNRSLFITGRPGQLIVYNEGAIAFATANREKWAIQNQWSNHLYSNIFAVQEIAYKNLMPCSGYFLALLFARKRSKNFKQTLIIFYGSQG